MPAKRALILSSLMHIALVLLLSMDYEWLWPRSKKIVTIDAQVFFKNSQLKEDLLPKKDPRPVVVTKKEEIKTPQIKEKPQEIAEKIEEKKPPVIAKKVEEKLPVAKKGLVAVDHKAKPKAKTDFAKELAKISQSFASDLEQKDAVPAQASEASAVDSTYFDQIYALIKESFVVPPHINGPQGKNLQAVLRLFLERDGSLAKLDLERSSGDEHFDKAVQEGTIRVNNFGRVPILLQDSLRERGIVVELCPFKCAER